MQIYILFSKLKNKIILLFPKYHFIYCTNISKKLIYNTKVQLFILNYLIIKNLDFDNLNKQIISAFFIIIKCLVFYFYEDAIISLIFRQQQIVNFQKEF